MTDQDRPKNEPIDSEKSTLTPWQKENIIYMKQKQMEDSEETEAEPEKIDVPEEEHEQVEEEPREYFVDRLPKVAHQRNKTLRRRLTLVIGILGIAVIFLVYYISPYSKLAGVSVSGNAQTATDDIIDTADFQLHENIWTQFFDQKAHIQQIKKRNPRIESVTIAIKDLNHFQIKVKEYKVVAYGWNNGQYHPLLENGVILNEIVAPENKELVTFKNFESDTEVLKEMLKLYEHFPEEIKNNIAEIQSNATKTNPYAVQLQMKDGNTVFGNSTDLDKKIIYYSDVANDMSVPGTIHMEAGIYSEQPPKEKEDSNSE